jgi:multidrug efflux pump subunit AcrB
MAVYIGEKSPLYHVSISGEEQTSNYAQFVVNTWDRPQALTMLDELDAYFKENIIEGRVDMKRIEEGPPVGAPIQVRVSGKDFDKLYKYTAQIKNIISSTPGTAYSFALY